MKKLLGLAAVAGTLLILLIGVTATAQADTANKMQGQVQMMVTQDVATTATDKGGMQFAAITDDKNEKADYGAYTNNGATMATINASAASATGQTDTVKGGADHTTIATTVMAINLVTSANGGNSTSDFRGSIVLTTTTAADTSAKTTAMVNNGWTTWISGGAFTPRMTANVFAVNNYGAVTTGDTRMGVTTATSLRTMAAG